MPVKGDRPPWSWQGATALVLSVSIGGGWLAGITLAALDAGKGGLDSELAQLLNGIGQVLAGALGTYLGFAAAGGNPRAQDPVPPEIMDPPPAAAPAAPPSTAPPTAADGATSA